MTDDRDHETPGEPAVDDLPEDEMDLDDEEMLEGENEEDPGPPHPVNWYLLRADELEKEWYALNRWVETTRRTYGLPASVIPPFWHRHDELVWELSALHTHWLNAYHPDGTPSEALSDRVTTAVDLYRQGRFDLDAFVTERIGIGDVEAAFEKMHGGDVLRSVVVL